VSNPLLDRLGREKIGDAGRKSEKKVASRLNARMTPNSGAKKGAKGDMSTRDWLIEAKATEKDSMSVQLDWLAKITGEASQDHKTPALTVTFVTGDGKPRKRGKWVMIPEHVFEELIGD
jgi:hypothetical protein